MTAVSDETGRELKPSRRCIFTTREGLASQSFISDLQPGALYAVVGPINDTLADMDHKFRDAIELVCIEDNFRNGSLTEPKYSKLKAERALSAAPVAQEPVAYQYRACIAGKWGDWTDLHQSVEGFRNGPWKFGLENGTCELRALYAGTPPATPAGVGADEIAQIIATKCFDPRVIDSSGKPFWKKSQWREAQQAANAILLLLSGGRSEQERSQMEGSL